MKRYLCAILLLLASLGAGAEPFRSPDGLFSIAFPGAPTVQSEALPSVTGASYTRTTYALQSDSYMLMAGVIDLGGELATTGDEQGYLDSVVTSFRGMQGFVPDQEGGVADIALGGYKGKEVKGTVNGMRLHLRAYLGAHRIFLTQSMHAEHNKSGQSVARTFIESLEIAKP